MQLLEFKDLFFQFANRFLRSESAFDEHMMRYSLRMLLRANMTDKRWRELPELVLQYLARTESTCITFRDIYSNEGIRSVIESIDFNLLTLINKLRDSHWNTELSKEQTAIRQATYYCTDMYKLFFASGDTIPMFMLAIEYARLSGHALGRGEDAEMESMLNYLYTDMFEVDLKTNLLKFSVQDYLSFFNGCFYNLASTHKEMNEYVLHMYNIVTEMQSVKLLCGMASTPFSMLSSLSRR